MAHCLGAAENLVCPCSKCVMSVASVSNVLSGSSRHLVDFILAHFLSDDFRAGGGLPANPPGQAPRVPHLVVTLGTSHCLQPTAGSLVANLRSTCSFRRKIPCLGAELGFGDKDLNSSLGAAASWLCGPRQSISGPEPVSSSMKRRHHFPSPRWQKHRTLQ